MTVTHDGLTISDVARETGLTTHTLRYYERAGLMLRPVDRASSTHRRYSTADVAWVVFLTRLRSTSMPIARVREYVDLVRAGDATVERRRDLLLEHRVLVVAQLEAIRQSLEHIDYKISNYDQKVDGT